MDHSWERTFVDIVLHRKKIVWLGDELVRNTIHKLWQWWRTDREQFRSLLLRKYTFCIIFCHLKFTCYWPKYMLAYTYILFFTKSNIIYFWFFIYFLSIIFFRLFFKTSKEIKLKKNIGKILFSPKGINERTIKLILNERLWFIN